MSKKQLKPAIVLTLICVIVALLLAVVNMLTRGVIENTEKETVQKSLQAVMPGGVFDTEKELDGTEPSSVEKIYEEKSGMGYVVVVTTRGFASDISMTVGVDKDGKITKVIITKEQETHNKAGFSSYPDSFSGKDAEGVDAVEKFSGATFSSRAVKRGIGDALTALGFSSAKEEPEIGLTAEEIDDIVKNEYWRDDAFDNVTPADAPATVKRVLRNRSNGNFIAYVMTIGLYTGDVETDGIVECDKDGKIIACDMRTWVVGHGVALPEKYTDAYIGKDKTTIDGVELVSTATTTSSNFRSAVKAALEICDDSSADSNLPHVLLCVALAFVLVGGITVAVVIEKGVFTAVKGGRKNEK